VIGNRPKQRPPSRSGGPGTLTYVLIAVVAILFAYYVLLPMFSHPSAPTVQKGAVISLSPSSDVVGAPVTLIATNLTASTNVTAKFEGSPVDLSGDCRTTSTGTLAGCIFLVPEVGPGAYNVTVSAGTTTASASFDIPQYSPPFSTFVVTLTSIGLGLVTQLVTRRIVDLDKERKMRAEVNAFNKEKREAQLAGDKTKLEKLKRRELQMAQERSKVSMARLKVTGITFVPLLVVYYLMSYLLGGFNILVAYSPVPIPILVAPFGATAYGFMSLFFWYMLSSFTFSTMLSKALHTTP